MMQVEKIEVWGFEHTIRGLRNPMNSWNKSDSIPGRQAGYQIGTEMIWSLCENFSKQA